MAPPSLLLRLRAPPSSSRSLCLLSKQRLQRLPSQGTGRRRVAVVVDKYAPRRPEAGRLTWTGGFACRCSYDPRNEPPAPPPGESLDEWPALRRWDVPWEWPTISLTMVACAVSSLLTGMIEQTVLEYLGYQAGEATIDEKAGVLFLGQLYGSKFLFLCMDCTRYCNSIPRSSACSEDYISPQIYLPFLYLQVK